MKSQVTGVFRIGGLTAVPPPVLLVFRDKYIRKEVSTILHLPMHEKCLLCKGYGFGYDTDMCLDPNIYWIKLCRKHWRQWRYNLFRFKVKPRRQLVTQFHQLFHHIPEPLGRESFPIFWDVLAKQSKPAECLKEIQEFFWGLVTLNENYKVKEKAKA